MVAQATEGLPFIDIKDNEIIFDDENKEKKLELLKNQLSEIQAHISFKSKHLLSRFVMVARPNLTLTTELQRCA